MLHRRISTEFVWSYVLPLLIVALITILTDVYVADLGVSYREVIVALFLVAGLKVALSDGRRGLKVGLVFLVATFGLGYRTISITPNLRIHPSELVLLGLLVLLIVQGTRSRRSKMMTRLPTWLILFVPFWLWGWRTIASGNIKWEAMFSECKNFIMLIPLFVVAATVLVDKSGWRPLLLTFYCVGIWIAVMGLLEYSYPPIKTFLPGFVSDPIPYETGEGFQRATFSFWGSADAVYLCVLALPIGTAVWAWWSGSWARVLNVALMATLLAGVYISGHRNAWFMITLQFFGFLAVKKQYLLGLIFLVVLIFAFQLLPNATRERIYSGVELVSGTPLKSDTSGTKRWGRATTSLANSFEAPLGKGWAGAGWVHNDFLQVSENLGLAAGVLFIGAFIFSLQRLWRRVYSRSKLGAQLIPGTALALSFTSAGIILATEAALELPQLILPIWFIWVTVEIWLRQTHMKRATIDDTSSDLSAFANLQLCGDRPRYIRGS